MYIEDLLSVYESSVKERYPELISSELTSSLALAIKNKKYDVQDQALIETFLQEDRATFSEEFLDTLSTRFEKEKDLKGFLISEESNKVVIELFIKSVEYMIDFYYNNIISKQFSST